MVNYECPRCEFSCTMKSTMKNHIQRKNPCKSVKFDINISEYEELILNREFSMIKCILCDEIFNNKDIYNDHKLDCDKKILEKIKKIEEENNSLKNQLTTKQSFGNTTHNTTNINFNFNLTSYNDPNLDGVEKYYLSAIKKMFMSIPYIIEQIHFNSDFPENHNICIKNFRTKLAKVFNGREWKTMNEDQLIDELIDTYERLLEDWAEDNPKRMHYIEKYNDIKLRDGKSKVYKDLKDEVKKLLYDKRDMIKIK